MLIIASVEACGPVYRRRNGQTYRKLSDSRHIPSHCLDGAWVEDGCIERLDPNELVEVLE
jgi:hypothetical protein